MLNWFTQRTETGRCLVSYTLTCLRPRCVNAEHSMYFTALILFAELFKGNKKTENFSC